MLPPAARNTRVDSIALTARRAELARSGLSQWRPSLRLFGGAGTFQDRLVTELSDASASTIAEAQTVL